MDTPLDDNLLEEIHADQNTNTGIENKKLIMWLFLASDCMFFGTLISTHLIYRKLYPFGHPEEGAVNITGTFDIELTSFSTFILLMSSFLMALAVSAMHKGSVKSFRSYTLGVIIFGLIFLGGQVYEFQHFFHGQGWYEWKAKNDAGLILQGNEGNELYFHDVANAGEAKETFVHHDHLGLVLESFKPAKGATADDRPVAFTWELDLPDTIGNVPEKFHGEYLYNPENPAASQIVILSEIPEQPKEEEAKPEGEAAKTEAENAEAKTQEGDAEATGEEAKANEGEAATADTEAKASESPEAQPQEATGEGTQPKDNAQEQGAGA
ncbi:MAG: hypothetical protein ACQKBV_00115 [Puniceicoccales bacterium]